MQCHKSEAEWKIKRLRSQILPLDRLEWMCDEADQLVSLSWLIGTLSHDLCQSRAGLLRSPKVK